MGEIADAMLNGTLCEGCGEYLHDDAVGFLRYCSIDCAQGRRARRAHVPPEGPPCEAPKVYPCPQCPKRFGTPGALGNHTRAAHRLATIACPDCGRVVKTTGLANHMRDKGCRAPLPPKYRPARPARVNDDFDLFDDGDL